MKIKRGNLTYIVSGLLALSLVGFYSYSHTYSASYAILQDYQYDTNGGNGYLRIFTFNPNSDELTVQTYSPYLDQYETDFNSYFELPFKTEGTTPFTFVILPDSQYYVSFGNLDVYWTEQIRWIKENKTPLNIKFVFHVGDIVDDANDISDWFYANQISALEDDNIPWGISLGNHDHIVNWQTLESDTSNFESWFPFSRFQSIPSFAGALNNNSTNTYYKYTINGEQWLFLFVQWNPTPEVYSWVNTIITSNPNTRIVLTTHEYLRGDDGELSHIGEEIYKNLVKNHLDKIDLILCGHVAREGLRVDYP